MSYWVVSRHYLQSSILRLKPLFVFGHCIPGITDCHSQSFQIPFIGRQLLFNIASAYPVFQLADQLILVNFGTLTALVSLSAPLGMRVVGKTLLWVGELPLLRQDRLSLTESLARTGSLGIRSGSLTTLLRASAQLALLTCIADDHTLPWCIHVCLAVYGAMVSKTATVPATNIEHEIVLRMAEMPWFPLAVQVAVNLRATSGAEQLLQNLLHSSFSCPIYIQVSLPSPLQRMVGVCPSSSRACSSADTWTFKGAHAKVFSKH